MTTNRPKAAHLTLTLHQPFLFACRWTAERVIAQCMTRLKPQMDTLSLTPNDNPGFGQAGHESARRTAKYVPLRVRLPGSAAPYSANSKVWPGLLRKLGYALHHSAQA